MTNDQCPMSNAEERLWGALRWHGHLAHGIGDEQAVTPARTRAGCPCHVDGGNKIVPAHASGREGSAGDGRARTKGLGLPGKGEPYTRQLWRTLR